MVKPKDVFGRLTVINLCGKRRGENLWECHCQCGNVATVTESNLLTGNSKSCGCARTENLIKRNTTHGMSKTPTYRFWAEIIKRYHRGQITIDKRWESFFNFFADMGEKPDGKTLRKKKQEKPYSKDNCEWGERQGKQKRQKKTKYIRLSFGTIIRKPRMSTIFSETNEHEWQTTLKDGTVVKVSPSDVELVSQFHWHKNKTGYIETRVTCDGRSRRIFLHRLVMDVLSEDWRKIQIDHINRDTTDNRRENLRPCTPSQNQINRGLRKDNTSGHTGVSFDGRSWIASLNGQVIGRSKDKQSAVKIRSKAEQQKYREFSNGGVGSGIEW